MSAPETQNQLKVKVSAPETATAAALLQLEVRISTLPWQIYLQQQKDKHLLEGLELKKKTESIFFLKQAEERMIFEQQQDEQMLEALIFQKHSELEEEPVSVILLKRAELVEETVNMKHAELAIVSAAVG